MVAAIAIATVAFFVLSSGRKMTDDRPVVRIGASLPLTGDLAPIGNVIKESLVMALSEIPVDSKYRYKIIFEDDQYDMKKIVTNANRLISIRNVDAMLFMFDGSNVSAPIAERREIPSLGCTWGADFFKDYEYSFNHWSRPETQAAAFVLLMKDENIKTISIIAQHSANITELMKAVEKQAKQNNIKLNPINYVNIDVKDFRMEITRMKKQQPDAVMIMLLDPQITIFAKQAAEQNLNIRFTSIDEIAHTPNKELLEGSIFVSSITGGDDFQERFAKHTNLSMKSCASNLYDWFKIIVDIFESSDHRLTGEELKNRIYQIKNFPSAMGIEISVDKDGIIDTPLFRARIKDGKVAKE